MVGHSYLTGNSMKQYIPLIGGLIASLLVIAVIVAFFLRPELVLAIIVFTMMGIILLGAAVIAITFAFITVYEWLQKVINQ